MRVPTASGVLLAALLSTTALAQPTPDRGNIAVTRVTLATGGLAQVEGRMRGAGDEMRLAIERPQIADVLRTLLVSGNAAVVSVDLEAAEPVGERSVTGRLLAGDLADPATLLTSLIGETVQLSGGITTVSGRLLAFNPVTIPGADNTPEKPGVRVALATADGRVAFATFASLDTLSIEGTAVEERMAGVVPALGETVDDGRRDLTIRLEGETVAGFSFVVPTTVWRPSYRAVIGDDGVTLQGWATLENTTGLDWENIELNLAVGTPVAYFQDVYSPLRTERPTAPFEVGRTAEAEIVAPSPGAMAPQRRVALGKIRGRSVAALLSNDQRESVSAPSPEIARLVTGDEAEATSAVTLFPVAGHIDLAAGRTLNVPFLGEAAEAGRIAYVPSLISTLAPMDALEIAFDAEATVPGGLVAVYDGANFVGDARFAGADGGKITILPFAHNADLDGTITNDTTRRISRAHRANGLLHVSREVVTQRTVRLEVREPLTLVADIPAPANRTVTAEAEGVTVRVERVDTGRARLRADLPAGTITLNVTLNDVLADGYRLLGVSDELIEEVLSVGGAVDQETRDVLGRLVEIRHRIDEIDRRIKTIETDQTEMRNAVDFDRKNLEAIDAGTSEGREVRRRILDRTEEINKGLAELRTLREERRMEADKLADL
ncbi:hypothetical protein [Acuticoccus mangrovi]|uniref:DUF4139 domain-containing protein n=1 Tax=Acuticoccus mangrovi TaxID=2796142 RepID=A0A934MDZ7_9HYPH|nr:hypothetical protein [Acuticoccus mangrovi]MBJ3776937.1 hypothetical protein [Acuticoccus mangrovi]